jgi:hypothetical protein
MSSDTIYDILRREHEVVQEILDKLDEAKGAARTRLLAKLKENLVPHMHAEEQEFYKPLREHDESHGTALDAQEEHRAATHVLHELERLSPDGELWHARFHVLKESIEHHVEEEEGELFKKAKQVFDRDEAVEIGERFLAAKEAEEAPEPRRRAG